MLEQVYNDFTTNLLPKINEGLSLTYEYFIELFGRYVKYLIVMDSIYLGVALLVFVMGIVLAHYAYKCFKLADWSGYGTVLFGITGTFALFIGFFSSLNYCSNLVKDIYIPEVRVYEELQVYMVNHGEG